MEQRKIHLHLANLLATGSRREGDRPHQQIDNALIRSSILAAAAAQTPATASAATTPENYHQHQQYQQQIMIPNNVSPLILALMNNATMIEHNNNNNNYHRSVASVSQPQQPILVSVGPVHQQLANANTVIILQQLLALHQQDQQKQQQQQHLIQWLLSQQINGATSANTRTTANNTILQDVALLQQLRLLSQQQQQQQQQQTLLQQEPMPAPSTLRVSKQSDNVIAAAAAAEVVAMANNSQRVLHPTLHPSMVINNKTSDKVESASSDTSLTSYSTGVKLASLLSNNILSLPSTSSTIDSNLSASARDTSSVVGDRHSHDSDAVTTSATAAAAAAATTTTTTTTTTTGKVIIPLSTPSDETNLSFYQCLLREQIVLFESPDADRIKQVGIQCKHCSVMKPSTRKNGSTYYPGCIAGIYQATQNMAKTHLIGCCTNIPKSIRDELILIRKFPTKSSPATGGKQYWIQSAKQLGVYERRQLLYTGSSSSASSNGVTNDGNNSKNKPKMYTSRLFLQR